MLKFTKKIGVFIGIFVSLALLIALASLWALRQGAFYKPSFLVNTVNQNQFDYIVLGASTGLTTLNTEAIDSLLGVEGLNLSMDDTGLASQYLMLQHFLAQGKTTKFCILAPSANGFDSPNSDVSDNDYRFLPFVGQSYVSNYYSEFDSQRAQLMQASSWCPALGVSYYNTELFYPALLSLVNPEKRNRFDDRGNYTYPVRQHQLPKIKETRTLELSFKNPYLKKLRALCDSNNIQLVCYLSPVQQTHVILKDSSYSVINHSSLLKNTMYFYDKIHVNTLGRTIASEQFAEAFKTYLID